MLSDAGKQRRLSEQGQEVLPLRRPNAGARLGPGVLDLGLHLEPPGAADWGIHPASPHIDLRPVGRAPGPPRPGRLGLGEEPADGCGLDSGPGEERCLVRVGSVHIAGDVIAWEVYTPSSNGLGSAEIRMRNVGTMALAVALLGL